MIRIIVDGSADMPAGWADTYKFDILPMPIQIGSTTYYQGEDITPDLFYKLVEKKENTPQTAAPSPARIQEFIERVCEVGDTALSINVSGKMSSTVAMVQQAARELKDKIDVVVFDSEAGSAVLALMAREARLRESAGESLEEILDGLKIIRDKVMVILTLDSLEFAHRSGRVGSLQAGVASFLNIKAIVTLKAGIMNVSEKVRTRKRALQRIVSNIQDHFGTEVIKVAIVHSQDPETAELLKEMIDDVMNVAETIFTELSISVAANLGPKTVGVIALPDKI